MKIKLITLSIIYLFQFLIIVQSLTGGGGNNG